MADTFNFVQGQDYSLAGSGIGITDTSIILQSLTLPNSEALITMTNFGTIGYATLEPETPREENVSFSGITQNVNGSATLTGVTRGLRFVAPYTQDLTLRQSHAGTTIMRFTNSAPFYNQLTGKNDDETITGTWTFTNPNYPRMDTATPAPTDNEQLATKKYVDDTAFAGAPNASTTIKGIVQEASVAQVNAGTSTGSTGAVLFPSPADLAASIYGLQLPSSTQKAALPGTSGTPSGTNLYVTNDDTATAATANKVARRLAGGNVTVVTETPLNNSTNAASTAYVDVGVTAGIAGASFSKLLYQSTTPVTSNTSDNSKHTLITNSIVGGMLSTGNVIRWRMKGKIDNGASVRTLTMRLEYGSTVVWTTAISSITGGALPTMQIIEIECLLYATGSTSAQRGTGNFSGQSTQATIANSGLFYAYDSGTPANATENSTGALNLLLTTQLDSATGAPSLTISSYTIEILR